ncbi:MAG: hypothetical protein IV100_30105 [Myxococcales bacterium]|nr:hypothetical protein [Myxococcales bacterium]
MLGLAALALGCGAQPVQVVRDVIRPGTSVPFGYMAFEVDLGDTRAARLLMKAPGFIDREIPLPASGAYTVRLQPGEWRIQVVGLPGSDDVVRFDTAASPSGAPADDVGYPEVAVPTPIGANRLTNGGRICAHRACTAAWRPFDHPNFSDWERFKRYLEATPAPESPPAESATPESDAPAP